MRDLRAWLASQRLDFFDLKEDFSYDPVEALVQFSIVYGLPALLTFDVSRTGFINKTRMIKFMLYEKDITWYVGRHLSNSERTSNQLANPFLTYLSSYGLAGEELRSMVTNLESYAGEVVTIAYGFLQQKFEFSTVQIKDLGKLTEDRITSEQWISIFLKLTEGYYSAIEPLMVLNTAPLFLVKLLEAPGVGRHGLRCLIAWSVLRRVGDLLEGAERPEAAGVLEHVCFEHVRLVMEPALMKEYMEGTVHTESLMKARNVTLSIKEAFKNVITHSSWMQNETREVALQKLAKMPVFVGFPGNIPDANSVEDHYGRLGDSSASRFFHDWRVALEQFSRQLFRDQKHAWFPLAEAKAFYLATNAIGVAAAALQPPFFYGAGPASYNFGALGTVGLKVGSDRDNGGWDIDWGLPGYIDAFNGLLWAKEAIAAPRQEKRERRLPDQSRSLKQVSPNIRSALPDDNIDSENLADFVGLLLATEAFQALPEQEMSLRLPELPLSAEQLFFVAHCLRWCGLVANDTDVAHHAPRRFRCNVPLMNSEAFARAFQCPAGSTMNPENKCAFW
ncbi:neprilysin-3-like [Haemaphysalis longicornis]